MKRLALVAAVKARVGQGYWYGTYSGHVSSEALLASKSKQFDKQYTAEYIARSRRWLDGKLTPGGGPGTPVQDCVGIIKGCVWIADFGGKYQAASDLSADGMYAKCTFAGTMASMPDLPGIVLHKPGHIGVYIGNGQAVESRGVDYGVVITPVDGRGWTGWGKCHLIDYAEVIPEVCNTYIVQLGVANATIEMQRSRIESLTADLAKANAGLSMAMTSLKQCTDDKVVLSVALKEDEEVLGALQSALGLLENWTKFGG